MATDTTRDWGMDFERIWGEGDNRYFRKFWRNVVRWLAENSAGSNRRLQVDVDKVIYRPGQPIQISVHAFDEEARPVDSYRILARIHQGGDQAKAPGDESSTSAPLEANRGEFGSTELSLRLHDHAFRGEIPRLRQMRCASIRARLSSSLLSKSSPWMVRRPRHRRQSSFNCSTTLPSFSTRGPTPEHLVQLATASGGQVLKTPEELANLLTRQSRAADRLIVSRRPVWDHPLLWALLLGLLAAEWIIRRRRGLA